MSTPDWVYEMYYTQYLGSQRMVKQAQKERRNTRMFAILWGAFGITYIVLTVLAETWWYLIFFATFMATAGLNAWLGWKFYPRQIRFWEKAVAEDKERLESLAPNLKENPDAA
jgi:hypothetical protein